MLDAFRNGAKRAIDAAASLEDVLRPFGRRAFERHAKDNGAGEAEERRKQAAALLARADASSRGTAPYASPKAIRLYAQAIQLDPGLEVARAALSNQRQRKAEHGIRPIAERPHSRRRRKEEKQARDQPQPDTKGAGHHIVRPPGASGTAYCLLCETGMDSEQIQDHICPCCANDVETLVPLQDAKRSLDAQLVCRSCWDDANRGDKCVWEWYWHGGGRPAPL
jgi:hypothetical protein